MKNTLFAVTTALLLIAMISLASAVIVTSVTADNLSPGNEGNIKITVENNLGEDVKDVTLTLDFTNLPLSPVGSSSDGFDRLYDGDNGYFSFRIKATNDISPGDYKIPYKITFLQDNISKDRIGSIGISVNAKSDLSYSISTDSPIVGQEGKINLKIINKGFADARFVTVKLYASGYTLLSEDEIYIGTISSDDFETASFDVQFTKENPIFTATVQYKDFDNQQKTSALNIPVTVYSREKALALGLIQKSNTPLYIGIVVIIIVLWLIWRWIAKKRRMKRSLQR